MRRHAFEGNIIIIEAPIVSLSKHGWQKQVSGVELVVFEDEVYRMSDKMFFLSEITNERLAEKVRQRMDVLVEARLWESMDSESSG